MPGDIFDIKKLKHPIVLSGKKHRYREVNTGALFKSKQSIKQHFSKGAYKSNFPKRILYIISLLTVYELSKYVTNDIIIRLTANDEIDAPCDYDINSHADLNSVHNYNAGGN
ncbi:hypothetical protein BUZ59_04330 [Staphylococcus kloosii]|nr:hypothetical protein BUZ59_04330 [Staphylococcus kloosii]